MQASRLMQVPSFLLYSALICFVQIKNYVPLPLLAAPRNRGRLFGGLSGDRVFWGVPPKPLFAQNLLA